MALTLADRLTLARIVLAPMAAAAYLLLPVEHAVCFWVCGWICGAAEFTDWLDGRVARARGEVSDFGKLADPFCDVFYRLFMFLVFLLPAGGVGYAVPPDALAHWWRWLGPPVYAVDAHGVLGAAAVPFIPVLLMTLREIVAGALRAMAATQGIVLAARNSGKLKAWLQGVTLITVCGLPALLGERSAWHLPLLAVLAWICAVVSVGSIIEYLWVNRRALAQLAAARKA
jgi:CDP-diacylglycerol--glycerol-3-phosphate 3-phosphatidyltransferase